MNIKIREGKRERERKVAKEREREGMGECKKLEEKENREKIKEETND